MTINLFINTFVVMCNDLKVKKKLTILVIFCTWPILYFYYVILIFFFTKNCFFFVSGEIYYLFKDFILNLNVKISSGN